MRHRKSTPAVVRASGDIDLATAPALERALADALHTQREVVLDLSQVTFMDCAGLNVLVAARNQADQQGRRLVLRGAGHHMTRLLKLTGLNRRLTVDS